jgi:hypothetical protein
MGGCVAAPVDGEPRGGAPASPASPASMDVLRISGNSLAPAALMNATLTTARLDAAAAAALAGTAEAREVLVYAVGCALDDTQSVAFTVDGVGYTLAGSIGIAPGWTSGALSASDAAWVSACLFAHVNLTETLVWISARGDHAGLSTTAQERADYKIEEGAFWGNAFVDLGPLAAYSCNGVDQAIADDYGDLPLRQCAQSNGMSLASETPCGMHYAGLCSDVCGTGQPYASCSFQGEQPATAVITTMLRGASE